MNLPEKYSQVHDNFNVFDVRPSRERSMGLHGDCSLDVSYLPVAPRHALNLIVQLLNRKQCGRTPRLVASFLDVP
jgi:hypothetical protein